MPTLKEGLSFYWYPVAFSSEVKPGASPLRRIVLERPVILRRLQSKELKAFFDFCPHRGAPLSAGSVEGDTLRCGYHGWTFDSTGTCVDMPGLDSERTKKLTKSVCLKRMAIEEIHGLIFVNLNEKPLAPLPSQPKQKAKFFLKEVFPVCLEDLIENFIDPLHTVYVHSGLIRNKKNSVQKRKIKYCSTSSELVIEHEEIYEKIGLLNKLINPKCVPLSHHEVVKFPNKIEIHYEFKNTLRYFQAEIYIRPENSKTSVAYIGLSFNFGFFTPILKVLIRLLARRVIQQDLKILTILSTNDPFKIPNRSQAPIYHSTNNERHFDELRRRLANIKTGGWDNEQKCGELEVLL